MLDNNEAFKDSNSNLNSLGGSLKEYQQMLKYELHFTYYHQAESIFELIFALEKHDSKDIWFYLSKPEKGRMWKFAKKVNDISECSSILRDKKIELKDGRKVSFYEWLMFDSLFPYTELDEEKAVITYNKIDDIISFMANDLSEKGEYNAFKHGMRVLPLIKDLKFEEAKKKKVLFKFDMANTFTYLNFPKEDPQKGINKGDVQEVTMGYNPEQDLIKINLLTTLLTNIIESRKKRFFDEGKIIQFLDIDIWKMLDDKQPKMSDFTLTHHLGKVRK